MHKNSFGIKRVADFFLTLLMSYCTKRKRSRSIQYKIDSAALKNNTQNDRKKNNIAGMTLVEVILAVVILTVGIIAVQRVFVNSFSVLSLIENHSEASRLLEDKIQNLDDKTHVQGLRGQPLSEASTVYGAAQLYNYEMALKKLDGNGNFLEGNAKISWTKRGLTKRIQRQFYLLVPYELWKK